MTTPTQAQIEAAAKVLVLFAPLGRLDECAYFAKAALTAAAHVGEPQHSVDFLEGIAEGKAAAIEHCKQVAIKYAERSGVISDGWAIAAALDKLKDVP